METPPAVDFRTAMVIAIFGGERPTGGWRLRISQVDRKEDVCNVSYQVIAPSRGAIVTQAITHPYAIVRVGGKCRTVKATAEHAQPR